MPLKATRNITGGVEGGDIKTWCMLKDTVTTGGVEVVVGGRGESEIYRRLSAVKYGNERYSDHYGGSAVGEEEVINSVVGKASQVMTDLKEELAAALEKKQDMMIIALLSGRATALKFNGPTAAVVQDLKTPEEVIALLQESTQGGAQGNQTHQSSASTQDTQDDQGKRTHQVKPKSVRGVVRVSNDQEVARLEARCVEKVRAAEEKLIEASRLINQVLAGLR
jgi:hypothetical protein